jgi:hypothetical protein
MGLLPPAIYNFHEDFFKNLSRGELTGHPLVWGAPKNSSDEILLDGNAKLFLTST